jgi:hypothetical protein
MGLAFSLITILSLLLWAILLVSRIGNSLKKTIIEKIDSDGSIQFCNKIFCSWDYKLKVKDNKKKDMELIKLTKSSYLRSFKVIIMINHNFFLSKYI